MSKFFVALVSILIVFNLSLFGYLTNNKSCKAFVPDTCDEGYGISTSSITDINSTPHLGRLLVTSGNYFHKSLGDFKYFLGIVELTEIYPADFTKMKFYINNTYTNMIQVRCIYNQILFYTKTYFNYNIDVIEKLKHFDYDSYKDKNQMNTEIFKLVEDYLKNGDIIGAYEFFLCNVEEILIKMEHIKGAVDINKIPEIPECWSLNQHYINTAQFAQYVSEVFMNI